MSSVTEIEISDLFSQLASYLKNGAHPTISEGKEDNNLSSSTSLNLSISKLSKSLNLTQLPNLTFLDTTLSLLGFKAPQVFDFTIQYLVNTIITVLSSSIICKSSHNAEFLQIGSSISPQDAFQLIEFVNDFIPKLKSIDGLPLDLLMRAVVKVAVSASHCRCLGPSRFRFNVGSVVERSAVVSKLACLLPIRDFAFEDHEVPMRLLFWYLDPLILKNDVSTILQETVKRPFLSLRKKFYEETNWRHFVICLVLSPVMFINARALLHHWFLLTGLGSILELLSEMILATIDVITKPTCWGISTVLSLKLPFSNAYFPGRKHLSRTLAGPLSSQSFLQLVHAISEEVSLMRKQLDPNIKQPAANVTLIDHKSIWGLAINFPDWFYFALVLLFFDNSHEENTPSTCTSYMLVIELLKYMESPSAAARYIAWILSPLDKYHEDLLFDGLTKISQCWVLKQPNSDPLRRMMPGCSKKLKKSKPGYHTENLTQRNEHDSQFISVFLEDFHRMIKTGNEGDVENSASTEGKPYALVPQHQIMFRRIPLGILIGCNRHIEEHGCELLLHYAATGRILHPRMSNNHLKQTSGGSEDNVISSSEWSKKAATAGACLVFTLTDIVERMSASLCQSEESGRDFICRVKSRSGRYLIKCIKRLILDQPHAKEDMPMLIDLHKRLEQWRHQGQDIFQLPTDLDVVMESLSLNASLV